MMRLPLLTRRRLCGSLLVITPAGRLAAATLQRSLLSNPGLAAEPRAPSLREIRRPCSLRKICQALSRRFKVSVAPDASLQELRVVWAFNAEPSLETILGRLAELTDSRVMERTSDEGRRRLILERKPETARREAAWKTEALSRTIRELLRAVDQYEHGSLNADSFSTNVRTYLNIGRAPELKYLRLLTPEQTGRLLHGELVRFPPGAIPESEIEQIVIERYSGPSVSDEPAEHVQKYRDDEVQRIHRYGLGLKIDFNRKGPRFHLLLQVGDRGADVLCGFGDDELGLPLTRTNPYRLLETEANNPPPAEVPMALRRRLEEDVVLPAAEGSWGAAVRALAPVVGMDFVSDGYLCRSQSIRHVPPGEKLVLAHRGVTAAEALDLVCGQYGYLWWQKEACCYFRARAWPWDEEYEVPDEFLDQWKAALARGGIGPREIAVLASLTPMQLNGLGQISGSPFLSRNNLDNEVVQQFLQFFRACSPAQQSQLMGPGLLVAPAQAAGYDALFPTTPPDAPPHPVRLRLTQKVSVDSSASPPISKVTMVVAWPLEPRVWQPEFSVEMPQGAGELNPPDPAADQKPM